MRKACTNTNTNTNAFWCNWNCKQTTTIACWQPQSRVYTQAHPYCTPYHICTLAVTLTRKKTHTCAFTYQRTNFGDSAIWVCKGVAPNGCVSVIWEWSHYWAFWDFSLPSLEMQEALIFNHPKVKKKGRSNICDHVSGVCGGVTPRGNVSVFSEWSWLMAFQEFSLT